MAVTARKIIRRLVAHRYRRNFVLANYTPPGWWECDVFELTKAGFFREYEVKVSRKDFQADGLKGTFVTRVDGDQQCAHLFNLATLKCGRCGGVLARRPTERKHDLLAAASGRGPGRFWYVVPEGLVTADELPAWAGLIEMYESGGHLFEREIRPAPRLHGQRIDPKAEDHARGICYWRMHDAIRSSKAADQEFGLAEGI